MNTLLLGPGRSRHRIHGGTFPTSPKEHLYIIDRDPHVRELWPDAAHIWNVDLRKPPFPLYEEFFDEIHAYEILNLLPGDEGEFFGFWREMWRVLKKKGKVYGTVPHWSSQWVYAYPSPQRVYTPGLLAYLDQTSNIAAQEKFEEEWPPPFSFFLHSAFYLSTPDTGANQGYHFILEKREA